MSLAALIASASLLISGNSEPAKINYETYQKPLIYAQASTENLSALLEEARILETKRPHYSISLYRRVMAEPGPSTDLKERAIGSLMKIYGKRVHFKKYDKWTVENELSFYNEVIEKHPESPHVAEAYLKSGEILCDSFLLLPKRFFEGIERLEQAYKRGNNTIKAKARFKQGWMENLIAGGWPSLWYDENLDTHYSKIQQHFSNRERASRRLREVITLAPKSEEAKMARNLLRTLDIKPFR